MISEGSRDTEATLKNEKRINYISKCVSIEKSYFKWNNITFLVFLICQFYSIFDQINKYSLGEQKRLISKTPRQ